MGATRGLSVVRDAETGALRAPTPAETRALQAQGMAPGMAPGARPAPLPMLTGPDGRRSIKLGNSRLVYSVVTRGADGTLDHYCVDGHDAAHAHASVHHASVAGAAPAAVQEIPRHDHQ